MSFIASFYLLPDSHRDGLVEAAVAQDRALKKRRWGIFRPKLPLAHDPFWTFLEQHAVEGPDFPWSGFVLVDLWELEPASTESDDPVGLELTRITGSYWASYLPADARRCLEKLRSSDWSDRRLAGTAENSGLSPAGLRDALAVYRQWLESVQEGFTGVLSNG